MVGDQGVQDHCAFLVVGHSWLQGHCVFIVVGHRGVQDHSVFIVVGHWIARSLCFIVIEHMGCRITGFL